MRVRKRKIQKRISSFLVLFFIILTLCTSISLPINALTSPIESLRQDRTQYTIFKENNIMFWNPYENNFCSEEYGSDYVEDDVSEDDVELLGDNGSTIFNYLVHNGYSKSAAAAIMGNLENENGALNPRVLEGGKVVDSDFVAWDTANNKKTFSGGFGIAQWTYYTRVKALQEFADSLGQKVTSLVVQVKYLMKELNDYGLSPSTLNSMDYRDAVKKILYDYENPKVKDEKELDERVSSGEKYAGKDVGDIVTDEETGETIVCVTMDELEKLEEVRNEESGMPLDDEEAYAQCNSEWGNMAYGSSTLCKSGCGPTSFATILSYLTGKGYTPADVVKVANQFGLYVPGTGTSWSASKKLSEYYGLKYTPVSSSGDIVDSINSYLKNGYMIHTSGKGSSPYSTNGHYIAIVGTTPDGKWKVANSGGGGTVKAYTPQQVINGMNKGNINAIGR